MKKPRVAIVYHFFAHYRAAIMRMLLDSTEVDYFLVGDLSDPDKSIEPWTPPKNKLVFAPCMKITSKLLWQKGLVRLAFRRDIDVMIFLGNANFLSTWVAAIAARFTGKRVLFWTHGWLRHERGLKAVARNIFYRLAHGLLLYGNRAKVFGIEEGFSSQSLYVVYNSLDFSAQQVNMVKATDAHIREIRNNLFSDSTTPVLVCTGRLIESKGLGILLRAISDLQANGHKTNLILVGDGPQREPLETLAKELGVTVHFHGPCYDERELSGLIMAANVTVNPGQIGLTAMHSLGYGTPVITHDEPDDQGPEWEAIIPGKTGDLFRRGDINDLAQVIAKWSVRPWPDENIRKECVSVIDRSYNPRVQQSIIDRAVTGRPAE